MPVSHKRAFRDVQHQEEIDIRERRNKAGFAEEDPTAPLRTAGIALSGGGVRSSAVSLGFLQALYEEHVLNQFDYLSTVSGGGFTGTYLSASLEEFPYETTIDWQIPADRTPGEQPSRSKRPLFIAREKDTSQPHEVRHLIFKGPYLRRFHELASTTMFGLIVNWALFFGALITVACALAMLFRWLDAPKQSAWAESLGFAGDVRRPLLIPFGVFLCWVVSHLLYVRSKAYDRQVFWSRISSILSMVLVTLLACAAVSIIVTGDISPRGAGHQPTESQAQSNQQVQTGLWIVAVVALVASLLPYFWREQLVRSGGGSPKKSWHTQIANVAGWGAVMGLPLLVFGLVAGENLFQHEVRRENRHELSRLSIRNWGEFAETLEREQAIFENALFGFPLTNEIPRGPRLAAIANRTTSADASPDRLTALANAEREREKLYEETFFIKRIASLPLVAFGHGPVYRQWVVRRRMDELADAVVESLNRYALGNPDMYLMFPAHLQLEPPTAQLDSRQLAYQKIRREALANARLPGADELRLATADAYDLSRPDTKPTVHGDPRFLELDASETHSRQVQHSLDLRRRVQATNRSLLQLWYGDKLRPVDTVFALNVQSQDQWLRFLIGGISLAVFLTLGLFVDMNWTSAQRFYHDRLADMWIYQGRRSGAHVKLSRMKSTEHGGPYHLINAAVSLDGPRRTMKHERQENFLFSRRFCGGDTVDFEPTVTYERHGITLSDAMAISGAAVSPQMITKSRVLRLAMLLANARTGQWLPNPAKALTLRQPNLIRLLLGWMLHNPEHAPYVHVLDGGLHDNTGIESLLRRGVKVIVACDASCDPNFQFLDILRLMRRMSVMDGIQFSSPDGGRVDFSPLVPDPATNLSQAHSILIRVTYPPANSGKPETAWLVYAKSTLTADDPEVIVKYKLNNPNFPADPTYDQSFDERRFECYRILGYKLGQSAIKELKKPNDRLTSPWLTQESWLQGPRPTQPTPTSREPTCPFEVLVEQRMPFNNDKIDALPESAGVFVLFSQGRVTQLESTTNARKDLLKIWRRRGTLDVVDQFSFSPCETQDRHVHEANLLRGYHSSVPPFA